MLSMLLSEFSHFLEQNFLYTSKDESSQLKAIDFGLSDFVRPGLCYLAMSFTILLSNITEFNSPFGLQMKGLMTL